MPSKSKAQHRLVAAKAAEGEGWAKEWLEKDKGMGKKSLPEKVAKRKKPKAAR